jgi:hypothetical protein
VALLLLLYEEPGMDFSALAEASGAGTSSQNGDECDEICCEALRLHPEEASQRSAANKIFIFIAIAIAIISIFIFIIAAADVVASRVVGRDHDIPGARVAERRRQRIEGLPSSAQVTTFGVHVYERVADEDMAAEEEESMGDDVGMESAACVEVPGAAAGLEGEDEGAGVGREAIEADHGAEEAIHGCSGRAEAGVAGEEGGPCD